MKQSARIAFISEHASPVALLGGADAGGQNVYVDEVSRHLAQRGYAVDVFTRRDSSTVPEVIDWASGVRVVNVTAGPPSYCSKDHLWPYMPAFRDAFLHFMQRHEIHYDVLHSNFWMSGWVAIELGRRLNVPVTHIFHALGLTKRRYQGSADTSPSVRIGIEKQVIRDVDSLIASCPHEQQELISDYDAYPAKISTIPLAVNTTVFQPVNKAEARRRLGLDKGDFVIVYVGRVLPRKDIRNVIQALALLLQRCSEREVTPAIKLLVVGGESPEPDPEITPEIGELQRLAASLGVSEHVQFFGNRQQESLCYYYGAGDVAVTTPWYEPFGLTPLEGMACARPVIGSAVGGITYTIVDGETGFLIPAQAPEVLAQRLSHLLQNPALGVQMGRVAYKRVVREFSWATVAARTAELYEELMAKPLHALRPAPFQTLRPTIVDTPSVGGGE